MESKVQILEHPQTHSHRHRRRTKDRITIETVANWCRAHAAAVCLIGFLLLGLLAEMPWLHRPVRADILRVIVVALAAMLVFRERASKLDLGELKNGPAPWILAVTAWAALLVAFPPSHAFPSAAHELQPFAIGELLRLLFGFGIYFAAAYWLRIEEVEAVLFGTLFLGAAVALYGIGTFNTQAATGSSMVSVFGNHEQAGSFLMLTFLPPVALALSKRVGPRWQTAGQVLALMIGAELMIALCRSAWIGTLFGVIVLLALKLKITGLKMTHTERNRLIVPLLLVAIAFGGIAFSDQIAPLVGNRAASFRAWTDDASLSNRIHRWKAACFMTRERPLTGWGLGSFPVLQQRFTGEGDPPEFVIRHGTGHSNIAHNYWVQWASETGVIGLFLYVGLFVAGFLTLLLAAFKTHGPFQQLLIGCIAAVAAAAADMVSAPSYTFPGVAALPFLWMGLSMTMARWSIETQAAENNTTASLVTPVWVHAAAGVAGLAAVAAVLWAGRG